MKTRKALALAAGILFATTIFAQTKTTFGVRAGINFQNINGRDMLDNKLENKLTTGFHAGLNAEIPVGTDFYVQPGVLFSTKGAQLEDSDDKINLNYIEVPINLLYKPEVGTGRLLLGFGPYIGFGIGGKYKPENGSNSDIDVKNTITPAEALSGYYYKSIDAGGNLLFGYEMSNKLSIQLNAQLGMVKINPKIEGLDDDNTSWKNTGFGISLGYRF